MSSVTSDKRERDLFLIKPVNYNLAELHNEASLVRDTTYPASNPENICKCCSLSTDSPQFELNTDLVNLGQLGVGFPLFFYTIKFFMLTFLIGFLACGLPCVIDNMDSYESQKEKDTNFASKTALHKGKDKNWQGIVMFILLILIVIFFIFYRRFVRKKIIDIDQRNITPSDFVVVVKGLPSDTDYNDLKNYMQNNSKPFGCSCEVVDVCPSYNITEYVTKVKKLRKLQHRIAVYKDYRDKHGKFPDEKILCFKKSVKLEQLESQVYELRKWKNRFETDKNLKIEQGSWAFIIFRKQTDSKEIIDYWAEKDIEKLSRYILMCLHKYVYHERTFNGNLISIEHAPEPSDVIWENLTVSSWVRVVKKLKTALATAGVLLLSFFIVLSIKIYEYKVYEETGKKHISNQENMKIKTVSFLLSLSIVVLNQIIGITIRYFSRYEKPTTWTEYNVTVFHKLLFSTTLNTVVVLIFVNSYDIEKGYAGSKGFDVNWFSQNYGIASDLFNLLLIDIFIIPLVQIFHPKYLVKLYNRRKALSGKLALTQSEANALWTNPELDIADRSARYVRTYLVVLIFAPLFPLGLLMGTVSMFTQYWTDKYLLLRRYTRPKTYGKYLSLAVLRWLPVCLLFFSVSNFFIQYESHNKKQEYLIVPLIGLSMCLLYFVFPFRKFCGKKVTAEEAIIYNMIPEENDYIKQLGNFTMDYMRSNPVTSKKGWDNWLHVIQETKGVEARQKMQVLYQYDIEQSGLFKYAETRPTSAVLNRLSLIEYQFAVDKSETWKGFANTGEMTYKPPASANEMVSNPALLVDKIYQGAGDTFGPIQTQLYPDIEPSVFSNQPNLTPYGPYAGQFPNTK